MDGAVKSITEFSDGARQTLGEGRQDSRRRRSERRARHDRQHPGSSKNANKVVEDVSKVTSKFGEHADDIDKIVADATELADRLNQASVRVDGILAKVDSLLGSDETKGLVKEASETLKSFKQVADTLNSRLGEITAGLARFSNQGLSDVDALVRDAGARSTASRKPSPISRATRSASFPGEMGPCASMTGGRGVDIDSRQPQDV